jgi:teichuronic acid exporter
MGSSIFNKTVSSVAWATAANWLGVFISLIQSVVLARLLPISDFGNFAYAYSIVIIAAVFATFGSGAAFTHRTEETADEQNSANTLFTFKTITVSIAVGIMLLCTYLFKFNESVRLGLVVLTVSFAFDQLFIHIPRIILVRRVAHRRLAILQFVSTLLSAISAIGLSLYYPSIWALLIGGLVRTVVSFVGFYIWRPIWIPKPRWDPEAIFYFFSYGGRNLIADILLTLLDRVDDLWTGFFWGEISLGIYSRAYRFATYPRQIVAGSINQVILGTYAELKENRLQLSKAFFRTNALLIRTGFLLAGLVALVAEEFIILVLTEKWLPMVNIFRLMLFFTLLDPLKASISHVFIAVGNPEKNIFARLTQLVILISSLSLFYLLTDLNAIGVAISINLMAVTGVCLMLFQARQYVDVSIIKLFFAPFISLSIGIGISVLLALVFKNTALIPLAIIKITSFVLFYSITLFVLEREELLIQITVLRRYFRIDLILNRFSRN